MLYKNFIPDCFWSLVAWSAFIVRCGCLSMCFRDNKELHILEHEILKSSSKVKVSLHFLMMFDFVSNHWNFAFCLVTYDRNNKRSGVFYRCFDKVFPRPYRYFSIALKVIASLSDCYKIFSNDWLWIEICQNVGFSKIYVTMTTINKNFGIDKYPILRDLDQLLKLVTLVT